jgi:large subunit ribosomal protein L10
MSTSTAVDGAETTVEHKRATVRPDKAAAVAEIAEAFRGASAAVLTEYRGLTVKQIVALRTALGADTTYSVVKNTLTKIAAADAGLEGVDELLAGPTAVAFINGEPVEAAKALRDFARANPALVVKGGVMDGKALSADEVRKLADLESREVLLAKMAGALLASLSNAVYLLNAPLQQVARLAAALEAKATEDPSVLRGGAGTPAPAVEAPVGGEAPADADADTASDAVAEASAAAEAAEQPAASADADAVEGTEAVGADSTSTESTSTESTSTESTSTDSETPPTV